MKQRVPHAAIVIGVLVAGGVVSASAQEQNNAWCAFFSGGPVNCGFATFGKCLSAIHGKTGLCDHNPDASPAGAHSNWRGNTNGVATRFARQNEKRGRTLGAGDKAKPAMPPNGPDVTPSRQRQQHRKRVKYQYQQRRNQAPHGLRIVRPKQFSQIERRIDRRI